MLYSTIIVAASAFAGFAAAQNSTVIPCCTLPATQIPADDRSSMCNANQNTCVELCGGLGDIASNGNECDDTTLENSCTCANGTDITSSLANYQQSVVGLMCQNFWFDACIGASGSNAAQQRACVTTRESECGNLTTDGANTGGSSDDDDSSSSSASASSTPTASGSSSPSASGSGAAATTTAAGAAANLAVYGTPALAGGLLAVFGFIL